MKRNWYAIAILVLLAAVLLGCKQYVSATAGSLRAQVQSAYAQTLTQQYPQAQQAFRQAAHSARQASKKLGLLVRRNALDRMNETMAVLPQYANPENQADLAVEAARVLAQMTGADSGHKLQLAVPQETGRTQAYPGKSGIVTDSGTGTRSSTAQPEWLNAKSTAAPAAKVTGTVQPTERQRIAGIASGDEG